MKKTKIIATVGPASEDYHILLELSKAGVNVFRLNFSHGLKREHISRIKKIRRIEKELKKPIAIIQDLQGPKIRIGNIEKEGISLIAGKKCILTAEKAQGSEIPIQCEEMIDEIKIGNRIFLDDGRLELKVLSKANNKIKCKIIIGGILFSKKGINLPDTNISLSGFTKKDYENLRLGMRYNVEYVALSFVKSAADIEKVRRIIKKANKKIKIIAKIERHEAIKNIDSIIQSSDAIMIARGDLGIEVSIERIPLLQKAIINKCIFYRKPVIVATHMLDSMIERPRSTRAETTDIANAILDGADAVMLSGETSVGKYPLDAVKAMSKIAIEAEKWAKDEEVYINKKIRHRDGVLDEALGKSACRLVYYLRAELIISATATGVTTRAVSKFRPCVPILSVTHDKKTARELQLAWGVYPHVLYYRSIDGMLNKAKEIVLKNRIAQKGNKTIVIAGHKINTAVGANIIKIEEI